MKGERNIYSTTKERLHLLRFANKEVITNETEKRKRSLALIRAMRLGNLFKNKVSIYFRDSLNRLIKVNTTIWGVTQKDVILKKGTLIPIHSIERVE
ncbi:hypothetical protein [Dokdonia donghaensis]|uniref:Uncharacterized protein n=1 Tax=Dokdonia donghaensis DSW-1 TaxID=1300343 RepID=A0A0A2H401_9FLAO|nr:hypothetical protein [Dokdonia donghaensis]ANH60039.1 hypothetical protein I597_1116 [Dokdonia donghaensis DSW-1]KGO07345.1 hypothetical protein NV36_11210 [Dokdonia donghaensis DSW-1]